MNTSRAASRIAARDASGSRRCLRGGRPAGARRREGRRDHGQGRRHRLARVEADDPRAVERRVERRLGGKARAHGGVELRVRAHGRVELRVRARGNSRVAIRVRAAAAAPAGANGGGPIYTEPVRAPFRARAGRVAARRGHRQRPRRADHEGGRAGREERWLRCRRRSRGGGSHGSGPQHLPLAEGRLREVRPGRARRAHADPEDLGADARPQLGDDPPRHPQRRGGHHRAGEFHVDSGIVRVRN